MAIKKMEHVGIVVDDLAAAIEFFVELGLEPGDKAQVEGEWVDRIIALDGTKAELAMLRTPDGHVDPHHAIRAQARLAEKSSL